LAIEKAFAIKASAEKIYAALQQELEEAAAHGDESFELLKRDPPRSIELRVTIGGVPCWLTYRLKPEQGYTEVAATLVPFGWRYVLFRIVTLGMRQQGYEMALVQGLANLKEAVEDGAAPDDA
jgi:hypothetical protein